MSPLAPRLLSPRANQQALGLEITILNRIALGKSTYGSEARGFAEELLTGFIDLLWASLSPTPPLSGNDPPR